MENLYLKEFKGEEMKKQWRKAFIEIQEDIHNEKQLGDYIAKIGTDLMAFEDIQFRIFFVKNYSNNQSLVMVKCRHGISDGVGILLAACGL